MKDIIADPNTKKYQLGLLQNIERNMRTSDREYRTNIRIVMDYVTAATSKAGMTSAYNYCDWLGIDPDGKTFY